MPAFGLAYLFREDELFTIYEKVDQMDPDEKIVEIAIERLRVLALELRNYMKIAHPGTFIFKPVN